MLRFISAASLSLFCEYSSAANFDGCSNFVADARSASLVILLSFS